MLDTCWIDLDGAANARDVAGLPVIDGGRVQPGRLLRSDNLQDLTDRDVRRLVDDLQLRTVIDLRMQYEVDGTGAGPLTREPSVAVRHLSLFRDGPEHETDNREEVLPWQRPPGSTRPDPRQTYRKYLDARPDSILAALRLIADSDGAALVHCAAGKDRTGAVVAMALSEVGVERAAIVADYVGDPDRIVRVIDRLVASPAYEWVEQMVDPLRHVPRAETMTDFLSDLDRDHGGVAAWLRAHGWSQTDAAALRTRLLD